MWVEFIEQLICLLVRLILSRNSKQADFRLANKTHKDLKTWIIFTLILVIIIMNCEL